ncbi:ribonucleotide reductase N-terminal alpha domain-containing protein, partial [Brevundimonas sp.]|uniref:ribonucleotide reductase N-terminal alpha domain-containing protein n=1 Tax=Brevundimonas sp. TaxID=1871086 RepID=UPI002ABCF377
MAGVEALKTVEIQAVASGTASDRPQLKVVPSIVLDRSRDDLLTAFGKKTLEDRYLLAGESYQDMFARVATAYADDEAVNPGHAQRVYDYSSNLWFMPSTPELSNGGADRGLPISCFLNA